MTGRLIGSSWFVDGLPRPIYEDAQGQYVLDGDGERIYGLYLLAEEECCDPPVIVDGPSYAKG